jgi:predicted ATPase/DNA-binding CsgD family transcriptional regulator
LNQERQLSERKRTPQGSNIPVVFSSFIGRQREIAEISQLLASAHVVSLVGAGGCGKTRLALRVVELADRHARSICWVDLARLTDLALVPQVVAKALGVVEQPGTPLIDTLLDSLCEGQTLLILDNCEHLLTACAQLVEALSSCPYLTILTTSREPLGVDGETLYPVLPLALPDAHLSLDEAAQIDSVRLFVERARSILPNFDLTPDNAASVATICRSLDGIPLAIELASARVNVLSVKQIQERLDRRFDLLVATVRANERHRTLRAAIDWSYELLSSSERVLLQRLALFAAGFTLNTAESVCAWGSIPRNEVLDLLASLVNKSLVVAETLQGSEARYRILETIRQYAQDKLALSAEWMTAHGHYVVSYLRLTEEISPKLREQYQQLWYNWLETENDNIRAALAWAVEQGRIEEGLRIGNAMYPFWHARAYTREGCVWFERLLKQADEKVALVVRVTSLTWLSALAAGAGDMQTSTARGDEALALCEAAGEEGQDALKVALIGAATAAQSAGDYETAYALSRRIFKLYHEVDDMISIRTGAAIEGQLATALGKYDEAQALLAESLTLARAATDTVLIGLALQALGDLARCEGHFAQASEYYEESLSSLEEVGATHEIAVTQHGLAYACLYQNNFERARSLFHEGLATMRAQGDRESVVKSLLGFAALASAMGLAGDSVRLYAATMANASGQPATRWPPEKLEYEHYFAQARGILSEAAFETEQAEGQALSIEQAIEYALNLSLSLSTPVAQGSTAPQLLTEREREVVILIAQGKSNGEIADELVLSKRTVEKHIGSILSKLDMTSRAQIVRWAIEQGLLKDSPSE